MRALRPRGAGPGRPLSASNVSLRAVGPVTYAIGAPEQLGLVLRETAPATTGQMRRELGNVLAAVDGPMFRFDEGERQRDYARFQHGQTRFAMYFPRRGIDDPGDRIDDGVSIYVANGVAGGEPGRGSRKPGESFRVQAYPSLVKAGVATPGLTDVDSNNRPAIGVLSDGRVFIALGRSISMPALAAALQGVNLGTPEAPVRVLWAGYLDGGGSAALYVDVQGDGAPEYTFNLEGRRIVSLVTLERVTAIDEVKTAVAVAFDNSVMRYTVIAVAAVAAILIAHHYLAKDISA